MILHHHPRLTNTVAHALLRLVALQFNWRPSLARLLRVEDGWLNFAIAFTTESGAVAQTLTFKNGRVRVAAGVVDGVDTTLIYRDEAALWEMLALPPNETFSLLMRGKMRVAGNLGHLSLFSYFLSVLLEKRYHRLLDDAARKTALGPNGAKAKLGVARAPERLSATPSDAVKFLAEPYLSRYSLDDFPRLRSFRDAHFATTPEICAERPLLLTEWYRRNGFETDASGRSWNPVLRQAHAFKHLMEHRRPAIRANDLLAGTTTAKDVGVVLYPDAHALFIWAELRTVAHRPLNPYRISPETERTLHHGVFPFWVDRTFREWVRTKRGAPRCQEIDERFAAYFTWKTVAISHTIPDFPRLLRLGARGLAVEIDDELRLQTNGDHAKRALLTAMKETLDGLTAYARGLAKEAKSEAAREREPYRQAELLRIAANCSRVPEFPAETLDEAVQSIWTAWIGMHMENTNTGLSLGRLDQWLQPYFAADMRRLKTSAEREAYVRHAIELLGCFYLRTADHVPLVPDIGNYLFGGSSSDQAITLGGVTPAGESGVCDMTYVLLKVTEMLKLRDPNVNARYSVTTNSDAYLRRLCEVNLVTTATPSLHGDDTVMRAIAHHGYTPEEVRDWSATGCVEPTISGRHMGHTGALMFNMVAALEMALHDGFHPLMRWNLGPQTGAPEAGAFATFEAFYAAFIKQLGFLAGEAVAYNNFLGEAHRVLRPTPYLSAFIEGARTSGRDVTEGGALYNTTGVACIGLADIVDSLVAVKRLVFDERVASFAALQTALAADFVGNEKLLARITKRIPKFGSGDAESLAIAQRVTRDVHDIFAAKRNARGGPYTTGFWSMSNHVAFGNLTGALPSGRRAGKAFTPGLTPVPDASKSLLDNLRDVAALDPETMDNNVAFNIKFVPSAADSHAVTVEQMRAYVKSYFELGGMQMQFNVVSSETLKDAMAHPENYRDLLVRISGYNAYFVTLNRDMQQELIERAEYGARGDAMRTAAPSQNPEPRSTPRGA